MGSNPGHGKVAFSNDSFTNEVSLPGSLPSFDGDSAKRCQGEVVEVLEGQRERLVTVLVPLVQAGLGVGVQVEG